MSDTILFVDDEENVLKALRRLFAGLDAEVLSATNGENALGVLRERPVSVIVSDNRMPGMTGIEFLQRAKEIAPGSVRILLTGYADTRSAIDAINKGEVYRFITKPWDDGELTAAVTEAVQRYDMIESLKRADEATLRSLAQTIELKDPYTRGHCDRVADYAVNLGERLGLAAEVLRNLRHGSWLHDCGKIGVPEGILNYDGPLGREQAEVMRNHSRWGADVARIAGLPDAVVKVILHHHEKYDGTGYPGGLRGEEIPAEARIVTIADTYDAMTTDRPYRRMMAKQDAAGALKELGGVALDPGMVEVFLRMIGEQDDDGIS